MLYRLLATGIVIFWLTMMGLLIGTEVSPASSRLRAVPLSHVAKLLFLHQQDSALIVSTEGVPVGHLRIQPSLEGATQHRIVSLIANFSLRKKPATRQRVYATGRLEMDSTLGFERFTLEITIKEPDLFYQIRIDARDNMVHIATKEAENDAPESHAYSLNAAGGADLIKDLDIDPTLLRAVGAKNAVHPEITARQSSLLIHGERADTYLINVSQSGQTLLEGHVDQLGKILSVKTFFGYNLAPEDLTP